MYYLKSVFALFLTLSISMTIINCSRSSFSANSTTPANSNNIVTDANGLPVGQPFGTDANGNTVHVDANGTYYVIDINGVAVITDANGNPITSGNPIVGIVNIQGNISPNQVGQTIVINPTSPGATCGQWVSASDVHAVHMSGLINTATSLNPQPGIGPAIHADEASLDRVCQEMGCGEALEAYTRYYSSPYNNTVVRWMNNNTWVKFGADWQQSINRKIGNKNGTKGIRCDAPGSGFTPGNVQVNNT